MGKQAKTKPGKGTRTRLNPLTGKLETIPGTKAGPKRSRLSQGDPLRTHITDEKHHKKK